MLQFGETKVVKEEFLCVSECGTKTNKYLGC